MAHVFLSYSQRDESRVRPLVQTLQKQRWSVFWDRRIPPGKTYRGHIAAALEEASCVVVVWSRHSVVSESVIEEAGEGRRRGRLVPVRLDRATPPFGFREVQYADFTDSRFTGSSPRLRALLDAVRTVVRPVARAGVKAKGKTVKQSGPSRRKTREPRQRSSGAMVKVGEVRLPKSDARASMLWDGSKGPREISVPVTFDTPFSRAPRVIVSLREIDLGDVNANIHRVSVRAENIGRQGFDLYFATWLESQVYGAVASWIAVSD